jgi:hypothetical protein
MTAAERDQGVTATLRRWVRRLLCVGSGVVEPLWYPEPPPRKPMP